jgi:putative tryptophan/tyrosine transport system substrate-binding protein
MKKIMLCLMGMLSMFPFVISGAAPDTTNAPPKTIGIVLPLEHTALQEIVTGFKETVTAEYPGKINFIVENAQHDLNIQRAIIQKFINQKVDLIVPVATTPAQMAINMVKNQPIVALAAMIPDSIRQKDNMANRFTGVRDEIDSKLQMEFIHAVLPEVHKITLIYSSDDKVIPEVAEAETAAKAFGITIQKMMIQNLSELYAVSQHIDSKSQAIFILKDNLVVSGINTLTSVAKQKHIPLISSDEGSVHQGATMALGVQEKQIGIQGGKLAARILSGEAVSSLPIENISQLEIFINTQSVKELGLNLALFDTFATSHQYNIEINPSDE